MSYLKTAYAHGQADALAALGIKQAALGQTLMGGLESAAGRVKSLFGSAARAGETQIGHMHPPSGAQLKAPPSGVQLKAPQDLIPEHIKELGAKGLTASGEVHNPLQPFSERLPARPRVEASIPGAAVKVNPTRDLSSQVGSIADIRAGQRPVGNADMLAALESMSFEGLGNMTGAMHAGPVSAGHSGVAAASPEMLAERAKWQELAGALQGAGGQVGAAPSRPHPKMFRLSDVMAGG